MPKAVSQGMQILKKVLENIEMQLVHVFVSLQHLIHFKIIVIVIKQTTQTDNHVRFDVEIGKIVIVHLQSVYLQEQKVGHRRCQ